MTTLRVVRTLPARWDGAPVTWSELRLTGGSLDLHLPPVCSSCGSTQAPWRAGGVIRTSRDPHTGLTGRVLALHARRCRDCLHDEVYDERTGESWDLGPEDYGPDGSDGVEGSLW